MSILKEKKYRNRLLGAASALALSALLLIGGEVKSSAASSQGGSSDMEITSSNVIYMVNPVYAGIATEDDLKKGTPVAITPQALNEAEKCTNVTEMAAALKDGLIKRQETIQVFFSLTGTSYTAKDLINLEYEALEKAIVHTGIGNEGDYLKWGYTGIGMQVSYGKSSGDTVGSFSYFLTYYTTAGQENQVTSKVQNISASLGLSSKSEVDKIKAVYGYICDNITYDYGSDVIKYSCYAAAVKKHAVCQGYSLLAYRLLNDSGVDCRLVAGNTSSGAHGWNIVKMGNVYYNFDSTWDAGMKEKSYKYFLKCNKNFKDHDRWEAYSSGEFNAAYPMSSSDYQTQKVETINKVILSVDKLSMDIGDIESLSVSVDPTDADYKTFKFSSSDKKVAKVSAFGEITALASGTCVITVATADGKSSNKCYVTVKGADNNTVSVKSVKLNKKSVKLKVKKKVKLKAKLNPKNATSKDVIWTTSNKAVATVNKKGVVKAKKKGTCYITVTTKDGLKTAKCKITVK